METYQRAFATSRIKDLVFFTLPLNVLKLNTSYRWRVRVIDNSNWEDVQNRSNSAYKYFYHRSLMDGQCLSARSRSGQLEFRLLDHRERHQLSVFGQSHRPGRRLLRRLYRRMASVAHCPQ